MLYAFFNFLSDTGKGTLQVTVLVFLDLQRLEIIRKGTSLQILLYRHFSVPFNLVLKMLTSYLFLNLSSSSLIFLPFLLLPLLL